MMSLPVTTSENNITTNIRTPRNAATQEQFILDLLECQICLSLICEPITLTCGHSFCRVCLMHCFRKLKKQCMICRQVCHLMPDIASENIMIRKVAMSVQPVMYASRAAEVAKERAMLASLLPVFSGCRDEIFPGHILSLHLFEPRYKLMIKRIAQSKQFVYVNQTSFNEDLTGRVAVIAQVTQCHFIRDDGQCLIEAQILFPRQTIVEIFEEPEAHGLLSAVLTAFRDQPLVPLLTSPTETEGATETETEAETETETETMVDARVVAGVESVESDLPCPRPTTLLVGREHRCPSDDNSSDDSHREEEVEEGEVKDGGDDVPSSPSRHLTHTTTENYRVSDREDLTTTTSSSSSSSASSRVEDAARVSAAVALIHRCLHLLSDSNSPPPPSLPALPPSLSTSPAPCRVTAAEQEALEHHSLVIMDRCMWRGGYYQNLRVDLSSQDTIQRLEQCAHLLEASRQSSFEAVRGVLKRSVSSLFGCDGSTLHSVDIYMCAMIALGVFLVGVGVIVNIITQAGGGFFSIDTAVLN